MFSQLRSLIGAARVLLGDVALGGEAHKQTSKIQSAATIELIQQGKLGSDDSATILELVQEVNWCGEDGSRILAVLYSIEDGTSGVGRRSMQD